jgi:hypothetical protein
MAVTAHLLAISEVALRRRVLAANVVGIVFSTILAVPSSTRAELPDAPEKAILLQYCTACHGIDRVENAGGSLYGWTDRIHRMMRWGTKIPIEQVEPVAAYLAKALPLRLRPPTAIGFQRSTALADATMRQIQTSVRVASTLDETGRILTAQLSAADAEFVKIGQRVRAFQIDSRAAMRPGKVTQLVTHAERSVLQATLVSGNREDESPYLMEVTTEHGWFLTVPNEAIIEEEQRRIVYVQRPSGDYSPRTIQTGIQGDRYTQIVAGLTEGDQVVTLGAFFIDSEYKLKSLNGDDR